MISMKREPEREEMPGEVEMDSPMYPEDLCLKLEAEDLERLGITSLPKVGSVMEIRARAYVKSSAVEKTHEGDEPKVEVQVTDMEIRGVDVAQSAATLLYGGQGS
jgi:hypothetical protein